jgi:DNA adenine methylase
MADRSQAKTLQPPLKWAGGKRWLVPYLEPIWRSQGKRRLVEPFCGGLAVTLGLRPEQALVNDINPHLINFFKQVQLGLHIAIPTENDKELFYTHRRRFNELVRHGEAESSEAAQLFYYLNRTGYNGLCRFNRSGEFNVPFGKYKSINYATDFFAYREPLSRWEFRVGRFDTVVLRPDDFVYADPPYDVEFVSYSKEGFIWDDHVRLAEWLVSHRGPVILSNQATERVVKLYQDLGFSLQFLESPRRINSTGDRTPALEVLALKGLDISHIATERTQDAVHQSRLL